MEFDETLRQSIEANKRNAQGYFGKTLEVQKRLSSLVGRASSGDGRVSVGFTTAGALTELRTDPRAMRMGADELTRTLLDLAAEAQADLKRQTEEIVSEAYGDQNPAEMFRDPEKFGENLRVMRDAFSGAMGESVTALNDLKRRMRM